MSIEKVRKYFAARGMEDQILEFDVSSATVELAAKALNCDGCLIAKTLSFLVHDDVILIVAPGDVKIDNHKYKSNKFKIYLVSIMQNKKHLFLEEKLQSRCLIFCLLSLCLHYRGRRQRSVGCTGLFKNKGRGRIVELAVLESNGFGGEAF